jgi:hypothetical protein
MSRKSLVKVPQMSREGLVRVLRMSCGCEMGFEKYLAYCKILKLLQ